MSAILSLAGLIILFAWAVAWIVSRVVCDVLDVDDTGFDPDDAGCPMDDRAYAHQDFARAERRQALIDLQRGRV